MEKQLSSAAYWLGVVCTVVALITRGLSAIGVLVFPITPGKASLAPKSFLDAAILFFVMAIASSVTMWAKSQKS